MNGDGAVLARVLYAMALADVDLEMPLVITADHHTLGADGMIRMTCLCGARQLLPIGARRCHACGQRYLVEFAAPGNGAAPAIT